MYIHECMKSNVISIRATATLADAAQLFISKHIGLLPVVDQDEKPIGSLALRDLVSMALPVFVHIVEDFDFVKDFGAVEGTKPSPEMLRQPVTTRMGPAFSVPENCGLLRAYALMYDHNLHDLPVVNAQGKLVGIASRVDLGTAILSTWQSSREGLP
jgi:CBS domain-containing protein